MQKQILLFLAGLLSVISHSQEAITSKLYETYNGYKEASLEKRRIKHKQIQPLIQRFDANPKFEVQKVGESIEGRNLHLISIGSGSENIFLWSQMHGNEPTATMAIFDILNFLDAPNSNLKKKSFFQN
ncbi:M14 family zinc carboxypeptidase [Flagellimonas sp. HMM57]|uniref:M14 family zinc carboxypeptidase n=1 Tax=Flagellimonas sp. HMM57 TaxID=2905121 RepID=UPI00351CFD1E